MSEYPDWDGPLATLVRDAHVAVVVGATDTGKTTFVTALANLAVAAGRKVAVVDADVGQSEVGPPGCIGLALPAEPFRLLADLSPAALAFVGGTSPRGRLLEHARALCAAAAAGRQSEPGFLLVDTGGFVEGAAARRLIQAEIGLLAADHVVALQRRDECEQALAALRGTERPTVVRLPVPATIRRKPAAFRTQRRAARFARCFADAQTAEMEFASTGFGGTWLNSGPPLAPHLRAFVERALKAPVHYAELASGHLGLVTGGAPADETGLGVIQEQLGYRSMTMTPAARLRHLLVGLSDGSGKLLGIGLVEAMDFRRRRIAILTAVRPASAVRHVQFGVLRLRPDGTELGTIRPGEI